MDYLSIYLKYILCPWIVLVSFIIFLAAIGKSSGLREAYVKLLINIFEYGRSNIESAQKQKRAVFNDSEDEGYGEGSEPKKQQEQESIIDNTEEIKENHLISRDSNLILTPNLFSSRNKKPEEAEGSEEKIHFEIKTWLKIFDYAKSGIEAIIEDQVTLRFEAEELKNWNLLTRTTQYYEFISWKLTFLWLGGFVVRYFLLLPLRLSIFIFGINWLLFTTTVISRMPDSEAKRWINNRCYVIAFRILTRSLSAVITVHNKEYRPKGGSICVANHTSPIDVIILSNDNSYSLIGQRQGGILGIIQTALDQASSHVWFERSESKDRSLVLQRLREHTSNPKNPPMLIFPEGTCINNTSVMQFKKGSFEVGCTIYPVAIKYDARFTDAFWNSSKYGMGHYLFRMMTSWALVCDVWYLPPERQREGESSIDYANRIKRLIAKQGGLVDLVWDGQLKRTKPKKEWRENQQEEFSKLWKAE